MSRHSAKETPPNVPVQQLSSDELTKRIRKLRWIGFEEEAARMQRKLSEVAPTGTVLTARHDTD